MADSLLVFSQALEGLVVRGLPGGASPELKAKLRAVGVDLDKPLLPAYPRETWARCIALCAEAMYPGEPRESAWQRLGERMIDGYQETFIGRAMFATLKLLGPRRMLSRTQRTFRSANNYTEVRLNEVGPTQVDVWINEVDDVLRHFTLGLVRAGMRAGGASGVQADILSTDAQGVTFRTSWRE
jgi:uncharacterized protein (TIGR02265 family)